MVLGIISAAAGAAALPLSMVAAPTSAVSTSTSVVSVAQGAASHQSKSEKSGAGESPDLENDPRLAKFTLRTYSDAKSSVGDQVLGMQVVLRNGKLYLDDPDPAHRRFRDGHPFSGFYIEYPIDHKPLALVSTIKQDPPELNWIYVDKNTLEIKYGNKTQSLPHIFAPWDWTDDTVGVTLDGWEGFVALEESSGTWALYYDRDDDLLEHVRGDRRVLECNLQRQLLAK